MATLPLTPELLEMYAQTGVQVAGRDSYVSAGFESDDVILTRDAGSVINGNAGNDILVGRSGNDQLNGGVGNDVLNGGVGNDTLNGGVGNDIYTFARGDGVDVISEYDTTAGNTDVVQFGDVASTEVTALERKENDLVLRYGTSDEVTLQYYFAPGSLSYKIEQLQFSDGVQWDEAAIKERVMMVGSAFADNITGYNDGANRIYGLDGNDVLYGGAQDDLIDGGTGDDYLEGYAGNDTLTGGQGNDKIYGGNGDDLIDGGIGNDLMYGGDGTDTVRFGKGYGADVFNSANTAAFRLDTVDLFDIEAGEVSLVRLGDALQVLVNGSSDSLSIGFYFATGKVSTVNTLRFADGTVWDEAAIKARVTTNGTTAADSITGYNDGTNRIYGLDGNDVLYGGAQDDLINGGAGNDTLTGNAGNDILQGATGTDTLNDASGNNLFNAGADNDVLTGGSGNELYIGGAGNDTITTGAGYDLIAFNRGDGQDTVAASTGRDNTLSLGGGIGYADLSLSRSGHDLVLTTGVDESITFKDWYANANNHSVANLQMLVENSSDYDAASADPLHSPKVAQFDFDAMVSRFDEARAASPGLTSWSLSSSLLAFHLGGSDTAAIGGDLAYQYGQYRNLSGISLSPAHSLLAGAQFGSASQDLQTSAALQDLSPRLS